MIPGTTPTLTLRLSDHTIDLTQADNIYFTLWQGAEKIRKTQDSMSIDGYSVEVLFDQQDTLRLREGVALIQLNWTYNTNSGVKRDATRVKSIEITKQLEMRVLE